MGALPLRHDPQIRSQGGFRPGAAVHRDPNVGDRMRRPLHIEPQGRQFPIESRLQVSAGRRRHRAVPIQDTPSACQADRRGIKANPHPYPLLCIGLTGRRSFPRLACRPVRASPTASYRIPDGFSSRPAYSRKGLYRHFPRPAAYTGREVVMDGSGRCSAPRRHRIDPPPRKSLRPAGIRD